MEPFLTTLVASLTAGAVAASKDIASSVVKDAYSAIKKRLIDHNSSLDFITLEKNPDNETVLVEFGNAVKSSGALDDEQIQALAEQLKEALRNDEKLVQEIGAELHHVKVGTANISDIVGFSKALYINDMEAKELNIGGIHRDKKKR